jgi:hypothetical protein
VPMKWIFICDDRGTTSWPSPTKTWALGGIVIDHRRRQAVVSAWTSVKRELSMDSSCELKWSHFFPGRHQERGTNPLISHDPQEWREQASWAIARLLDVPGIVPLTMYVAKDEASDAVFKRAKGMSQQEHRPLDTDMLFLGPIGQFAVFLMEHGGTGEIWFDRLGSEGEERRRQEAWQQLRDGEWKGNPRYQKVLKRMSRQIKFLDSRANPLVQVADFVSGPIWAASEGDQSFLLRALHKYFPTGPSTYTLLGVS